MAGTAGSRARRRRASHAGGALLGTLSILPLVAGAGPVRAASRDADVACRAGPTRQDILASVGLRGELGLESGARVVLDSARWSDDPEIAEAARAWLAVRRGEPVRVTSRGQPDRWARERADVEPETGAPDLAGGLVAAGLATADSGEAETLCRPALRVVEAAARSRRLGLWRRPVPEAVDGAALRALAGHFAIVEGRVHHVGERGARTYLDFGSRGADALTVMVSKRTWRMVRARGLSAASLEKRRVRVRGVLELWRGTTLEVAADGIEILDTEVPGESDRSEAGP
jgi:hypothetical protein